MKYIYIFILILFNFSIYSQSLELFGGMTLNKFYDTDDTRPRHNGTYSSGSDIFIGLGFHQVDMSDAKLGFTLTYEKYGGDLRGFSGGMGGGLTVDAKITKSILSFGIFPLDKKVFKEFNINEGFIFSKLIKETYNGSYKISITSNSSLSTNEELRDKYKSFSTSSQIGLKAGLSYDIYISDKVFLKPQYSFYFGLSKEIKEFPRTVKSMRHFLGVGIKRKLN